MLSRLHIENYVLIDSLDISFPGGLSIITGRTGAGKSILLGALSLVTGGKAETGMIGSHGDGCVVEADFKVEADGPLKTFFEENDLEWDDGRLTLRRVLSPSGRSRCFINDLPVAQPVLASLSASLLDIHSQHQTLLLSDAAWQLQVLDRYAGSTALVQECRRLWRKTGALRRELESVRSRIAEAAEQRDYRLTRLERLSRAALVPGELEELDAEQKRLANAEEIKENLYAAQSLLSPSEGGGVISLLKEAERLLRRIGKYVPGAEALSDRLDESRIELDDILSTLTDIEERTEVSPERLQVVEERLSLLYTLMKQHNVSDIESLIAVRDALAAEVSGSEDLEEQAAQLQAEVTASENAYREVCRQLSAARNAAAPAFSAAVEEKLRYLELEKATFRIEVLSADPGASGQDAVRFLFAADGIREAEVAKAASGGELSRMMLSLKAVMARYGEMPTMIFDEIDTGVSGSAADRMGSLICAMGNDMQVIAITHLPQVAAKGDAHFLVTKTEDPATGESVTGISQLSDEARLMELARMLSGSSLTDAAVRNAEELLRARG